MYKLAFIIFMVFEIGFSQTKSEINTFLNRIGENVENSKDIIENENAQTIIKSGDKSILILTEFYNVKTETKTYSDCLNRKLNISEVAIILTDKIVLNSGTIFPYFQLTGIQNCTLTFCDKNPNLIEYYLEAINEKGTEKFKSNFLEWFKIHKNNNETSKLSNKEVREILEFPYWKKKKMNLGSRKHTLYSFEFNRFSNKKGTFVEYELNKGIRKTNSEIKFKITRDSNDYLKITFQDIDGKWISKLNYLSKFEIILNNVKYNYVRIE